ncbi:probable THO complex subunit 7B [Coccomyxa sp. Obi]|nr:probable THO complex subunit 7B [Coccomyxa sp. Obi]
MENEAIIRHRLLTGTSTTRGEPPLKKLALSLIAFGQEIPAAQEEKLYKSLCSDIANVESLARRQEAVQAACMREAARYEEKRAEIQGRIRSAEADIEVAKADLAAAQLVREHQQEYEAKKSEIVRVMGRVATAAEVQKVMAEVAAIEADSAHVDDTLAVGRRKAAAALLHSLEVVQVGRECEGTLPPSTRIGSLATGPS